VGKKERWGRRDFASPRSRIFFSGETRSTSYFLSLTG